MGSSQRERARKLGASDRLTPGKFQSSIAGTDRAEVAVTEHATTYFVPDTETLWRGGLGSLLLTGDAIRHQDTATQDLIRTAFERCASVYKSANGLNPPVH